MANLTRNLTSNSSGLLENVTNSLVNLTTNLTNGTAPFSLPGDESASDWTKIGIIAGGAVVLTTVACIAVKRSWNRLSGCWRKSRKNVDNDDAFSESLASSQSHSAGSAPYSSSQSHSDRSAPYSSSEQRVPDWISHPDSWVAKQNDFQLGPKSYQQGPHSISEDKAFSLQRRGALANNGVELSVLAGADSQRSLPSRPAYGDPLNPEFDEQ